MSEEEYEVETILEKRVRKGKVTFITFLHILVYHFILVFCPRNIALNVKAIGLNVCFRGMGGGRFAVFLEPLNRPHVPSSLRIFKI